MTAQTWSSRLLVRFLLLVAPAWGILYPNQFNVQSLGQFNCAQCIDNVLGIPPTTVATTLYPEVTTQNAFQRAGWETDDKGNVFTGTDDAKLLLISVGSYWPFPKDYRKK